MQQQGMDSDKIHPGGVVISALRGGSGKTILSIGIAAAWRNQGKSIAPFKKGPDYIDAGWLTLAAGRPCYNLDSFLCSKEQVFFSFQSHIQQNDIAVVEGNRGLYDGIDIEGTTSTAEIAKLLNFPVILCIDATKTTRTMAAVVKGCINFDPDVHIKGVILNRVAGARHESILRRSIEHHCKTPVIGAIPKLRSQDFPERHMGLVPTHEHKWAKDSVAAAAKVANRYIDLDALFEIANHVSIPGDVTGNSQPVTLNPQPAVTIGIFKDSAFQFYYPDNIEALKAAGAQTIFLSPLTDKNLPEIDALYIGGGFPETHAKKLAANNEFRKQVKSLAEQGLPIYAECGGLMYLGRELEMEGKTYPMTGVLPIVFGLSKKPQGHGYTISEVDGQNPYFKVGTELKGHEFHYSKVLKWDGKDKDMVLSTKRGAGFTNKRDGICYKNVFATYTHIHAIGTPTWADAMVKAAETYKKCKVPKV
jgi:cobyrinic acid a,c-diamide synthase